MTVHNSILSWRQRRRPTQMDLHWHFCLGLGVPSILLRRPDDYFYDVVVDDDGSPLET